MNYIFENSIFNTKSKYFFFLLWMEIVLSKEYCKIIFFLIADHFLSFFYNRKIVFLPLGKRWRLPKFFWLPTPYQNIRKQFYDLKNINPPQYSVYTAGVNLSFTNFFFINKGIYEKCLRFKTFIWFCIHSSHLFKSSWSQ